MKNISDNSLVFNAGVKILGLKVTRVWSRAGWWNGFFRGLDELNPYQFGDLPTSWAMSFQECLEGAFSRSDVFYPPHNMTIAPENFLYFGGQYGEVYFGRDVSFFIDGIFGEIDEPWWGASVPVSIAFPSSLFLEFLAFAVSNDKKNIKKTNFKSSIFPAIAVSTDVVGLYTKFKVTPTLHEFKLGDDGVIEPIPSSESRNVIFGEISIPEALTIGAAMDALRRVDATELEKAIDLGKSEDIFSLRGEIPAMCDGMVLLCNDVISFIIPPGFLSGAITANFATLPPVAVPTDKLVKLLQTIRSEQGKESVEHS